MSSDQLMILLHSETTSFSHLYYGIYDIYIT